MMEGDTIIINSNNSCLICFMKLGENHSLFPIHRLSRKLNVNLGRVFPDVIPRFRDYIDGETEQASQILSELKLFCHLCQDCANICEKLEQSDLSVRDGEVKGQAKLLYDKLNKIRLDEGYKYTDRYITTPGLRPLALIHLGILERFKNEIKTKVQLILENPFENDIVIGKILSYMKFDMVKSCRLINNQWNINSYNILKRSVNPRLDLESWGIFTRKKSSVESLISTLERGNLPIGGKVNVYADFLAFVECSSQGNLSRLLNALSPNLTELVFSCDPNNFDKVQVRYPKGLIFPHIVRIHIDIDFNPVYGARGQNYFELLRGFIQNSPKLAEISIKTDRNTWVETLEPLIDILRKEQVGNRLTSFEIFDIFGCFNSIHYDQLGEVGLKLKKAVMRSEWSNAESLNAFLNTQRESLEELDVDFGCAQYELGVMPKLKVLKIFGIVRLWPSNYFNLNQRMAYGKQFPSLEHLKIDELIGDMLDMSRFLHSGKSKSDIGVSVKRLEIRKIVPTLQQMENAAFLFPNLRKLEIPARMDILRVVYKRMRQLQELQLNFDQYFNNIEEGNKEINNLLMGDHPDEEGNENYTFAESLLSLTELNTLRIKCDEENIIGENVCRRVFMKMESLKLITFSLPEITDVGISLSLLDEMRKKGIVISAKCRWNM